MSTRCKEMERRRRWQSLRLPVFFTGFLVWYNDWRQLKLTQFIIPQTGSPKYGYVDDRNEHATPSLPRTTKPTPIEICDRIAPMDPILDIPASTQHRAGCYLLNDPPEETTILLLYGLNTFGRTGNNLIEFFHALQYANVNHMVVGIMQDNSWVTRVITEMWMAVQDANNLTEWEYEFEQSFCVKLFDSHNRLSPYKEVRSIRGIESVKLLFDWRHEGSFNDLFVFQSEIIRSLWRSYNNGTGFDIQRQPVWDMCSVLTAIFGPENRGFAIYSVVHSRSLEADGKRIMNVVAASTGIDPTAALEMEPEYIKGILEPLGMLNYPIVFMTDHQRPEILNRLLADPDIGTNIVLIPSEASWVGGDITLATTASVFIGNPASTFSGFIAKSRVALGYNHNYLYRRRDENGTWVEICDHYCYFW